MSIRSAWRRALPRNRRAVVVGCCLTLVLNLALGEVPAPTAAGAAPVAGPGVPEATAQMLRELVERDGRVRVQVDLRATGATAAARAATRAAVPAGDLADEGAQTTQDLLFALPAGSYSGVQRVAGAASLTLSVDAAGLDGLLVSPLVAGVGAAGLVDMRRIAAGWHNLAINPDGSLWAWGANYAGQLGDGTITDQSSPVQQSSPIQVLTGVAAVASGYGHSLAIKTDGSLWAWGGNESGQLGDGTTSKRPSPVQILTGVAAIAGGNSHTLALKTDGSLWAWGRNNDGEIGDGTTTNRSTPVRILIGVAAIEVGAFHSLAVKTDGSLWAWGSNDNGQLGDGTTINRLRPLRILTGVAAVTGGERHSLALKTDGSLWAWGRNEYGQIGDGTITNRSSPVRVLTGVAAVAAGRSKQSLAIKTDGSLWAWGHNGRGQLGDGTITNRSSPIQVMTGVTAVAAGLFHTLALKTDSSLWTWGWNGWGALGDGTTTDHANPVQVQWLGFPDFEVTSIALTPTGTITNRTFTAAVTVTNQGMASGTGGYLDLWTDQTAPQPCGADGNTFVAVGSLAAGASRTLTFPGLRSGAVGTKTLRAYVDSRCQGRETDEANNQLTRTYRVAAPVADFVVTGVLLTPETPFAQGTFSAAVTVRNQGLGAGTPGTLRLWSNRADVPACGTAGDRSVAVASLAAGASRTVTVTGVPTGTTAGVRTLRAFVDALCLTGETNETNNQFTRAYTVKPPVPDFAVTAVVLTPSGPVASKTFDVAVTVRNQGPVAGTPGTLQVWSNQSGVRACGTMGDKYLSLASLAPGAATTVTLRGLPAGAVGAKTLRAFIDSKCATTESDEANNQFTRAYTVFARPLPDFVVTSVVPTPASPRANAPFSVAVTVQNQGAGSGDGSFLDVWAQQVPDQPCGASGAAYAEVGTLAAGARRTLTVTGLRAGAAGARTLRAFVDSACDTAEADDGNNQAVQAYTVAP